AAAAFYPLLFALLFIALRWDGSWENALRLALRPLTASLYVVWLAGKTPYPDLFAPLSRVLPRQVGGGVFLTYRALFELLGRAERMFRALHLRAAASLPARRRLPLASEALGTLVLHGFNGCGKTTLLFHILGLLEPQEGEVAVFGVNPSRHFNRIRERVGVLMQNVDEQILAPTVWDEVSFSPRNYGYSDAEVAK